MNIDNTGKPYLDHSQVIARFLQEYGEHCKEYDIDPIEWLDDSFVVYPAWEDPSLYVDEGCRYDVFIVYPQDCKFGTHRIEHVIDATIADLRNRALVLN